MVLGIGTGTQTYKACAPAIDLSTLQKGCIDTHTVFFRYILFMSVCFIEESYLKGKIGKTKRELKCWGRRQSDHMALLRFKGVESIFRFHSSPIPRVFA